MVYFSQAGPLSSELDFINTPEQEVILKQKYDQKIEIQIGRNFHTAINIIPIK